MEQEGTSWEREDHQQATIEQLRQQVAELQVAMSTQTAASTVAKEKMTKQKLKAHSSRIICWSCNQQGHVARECPITKATSQSKKSGGGAAKTSVLTSRRKPKVKVYMEIIYKGQKYKALLDTGCDISVVSSRVLPGLSYQEERQRLLAANLSPVPILGVTSVCFSVGGVKMEHTFLVSDAVEEIFFGSDWLGENRCQWDFGSGTLRLDTPSRQVPIQLMDKGPRQSIRRIYAQETVELPPGTQKDLAVKSVFTTWPLVKGEWIVEPKELHPGVLMARTLLSTDAETTKIRVINCGQVPCTLLAGELLATAEQKPLMAV